MSQTFVPSSFQLLFELVFQDYEKQTGTKLVDHPLAKEIQACDSFESITTFFQQQTATFRGSKGVDGKVMKSLKCVVHILFMLSASTALGEGVGLVRHKASIESPGFDASTAILACKSNICRSRYPTRSMFVPSLYTTFERLSCRLSRTSMRAMILSLTSSSPLKASSNGLTFIPEFLLRQS
jgi:hypothetical protein